MTTTSLPPSPPPDFAGLARVLRGESEPRRVHLVELGIDPEVRRLLVECFLDESWIPHTSETDERYFRQLVALYCRLGYDFVPVPQWPTAWANHPTVQPRRAGDTAALSRGEREWVDEGGGLIGSWEDAERFPWDAITPALSPYELAARHLPEGMKIAVETCHFEHVLEYLLGYEGLFYKLHDEPELVAHVFDRWGEKIYTFYRSVVGMDEVGVLFHADDLGFKTSTLLSPRHLRQLFFPWLKRYADLAHQHGKMLWLHSCGNLYDAGVIEDLIDDVGIDALHSFQDVVLPVVDFKARYGGRLAALGGVDVDRLVRAEEDDLRGYVRTILERCVPGGRFAFGTGNTVANYVPLERYLVLLEEAGRWRP